MIQKRFFLFLAVVFVFQIDSFSQSIRDGWYIYTEYEPYKLEKVIEYDDLQAKQNPNDHGVGAYSSLNSSSNFAKKIEAWLRENGWGAPGRSQGFSKLTVRSSVYSVESKYGVDDTYLAEKDIRNNLSDNTTYENLDILTKIEFKSGRFKISLTEPPLYIWDRVRGTSFENSFIDKRKSIRPEIEKMFIEILDDFEKFLKADEEW